MYGAIRVSGTHEHFDSLQPSDNCGAVIAYSLGPGLLVSASNSQPQELSSNPIFPAAIWRRSRQIAAGRVFRFRLPGVTPASLSLVGSPQAICCHRSAVPILRVELTIPKPDSLEVLAYDVMIEENYDASS